LERTSERSVAGLGGIDLALRFGHRAHIVFVTAYDEYAVRAFELGAIDYLLKPIAPARLRETVQRLVERGLQHPPAIDALLATLRRELTPSAPRDRLKWITASLGETTKLYAVDDVIAFRAQDKYTLVVTAADEAIIRTSLRELVQKLDPDEFWQIHRSVVVRAAAIDQIKRDELGKSWLTLRGRTEQLPVSTTFAARFRGM
jgi:DNA-binding LytR/AlgR family response regulator